MGIHTGDKSNTNHQRTSKEIPGINLDWKMGTRRGDDWVIDHFLDISGFYMIEGP